MPCPELFNVIARRNQEQTLVLKFLLSCFEEIGLEKSMNQICYLGIYLFSIVHASTVTLLLPSLLFQNLHIA